MRAGRNGMFLWSAGIQDGARLLCFGDCIWSGKPRRPRRNGAKAGDRIFVSGTIGGFGAALAYFVVGRSRGLRLPEDEEKWLRDRLIHPVARVNVGRALLASQLCTSCIDITDGVGQSLREIAEASSVVMKVDFDTLPVHPVTRKVASMIGCDLERIVFGIGLDLELLGTMRGRKRRRWPKLTGCTTAAKYWRVPPVWL